MSFLGKALRRAEVFLEQVDESVAQASRRMVVEGATGDVDDGDDDWVPLSDDPNQASVIEASEHKAPQEDGSRRVQAPSVGTRRRGVANIPRARRTSRAENLALTEGGPAEPADQASTSQLAASLGSSSANEQRKGEAEQSVQPDGNPEATPKPTEELKTLSNSEIRNVRGNAVTDAAVDGSRAIDPPTDSSTGLSINAPADAPVDAATDADTNAHARLPASSASGPRGPPAVEESSAVISSGTVAENTLQEGVDNHPGSEPEAEAEDPWGEFDIPDEELDAGHGTEVRTPSDSAPEANKDARPQEVSASQLGSAATLTEPAHRPASPEEPSSESQPTNATAQTPTRTRTASNIVNGEALNSGVKAVQGLLASVRVPDLTKRRNAGKPRADDDAMPRRAKGTSAEDDDDGSEEDEIVEIEAENMELRRELELAEEDFENLLTERTKHINNLKRLKQVVTDMDEALEEKSAEVRELQTEAIALRDEVDKYRHDAKDSASKGKEALERLRKELGDRIEGLKGEMESMRSREQKLVSENANLSRAMTEGREVDMATADDARQEASNAHSAYEREAAAHQETRITSKKRMEELEEEASLAAAALATAQRKSDEASAALAAAKSSQRASEAKLAQVTEARDAALARVMDLSKALALYEGDGSGKPPGQEELASLQQTVSELENALEAKNVELTRLEGDVENLRDALKSRTEAERAGQAGMNSVSHHQNSVEVEQKLRHMADSALRKQAQVEALRSENKALQHQLETERKRTREAQAMAAAATSSKHTLRGGFRGIVEIGDEERGERSYGPREGPMTRFRAPRGWPRHVTRFLISMDKVSAQALTFLRREPLLRIGIIVYLVTLHVFIYGLLHFHMDRTMSADAAAGLHAHPHGPVVRNDGVGVIAKDVVASEGKV